MQLPNKIFDDTIEERDKEIEDFFLPIYAFFPSQRSNKIWYQIIFQAVLTQLRSCRRISYWKQKYSSGSGKHSFWISLHNNSLIWN